MAGQLNHDGQEGQYAITHMGWGPNYGPFTYRPLSEPYLSEELMRMSFARTQDEIDSVTLQPCLDPYQSIQDRRVVQKWDIRGANWTFTAIFDGHGGHDTVNFVSEQLPEMIRASLAVAIKKSDHTSPLLSTTVSRLLAACIKTVDDKLTEELLEMFPGGPEGVSKLADVEIMRIINQPGNAPKIQRCMSGSTVLVALVDPRHENLWVASLGDCLAVLGEIDPRNTRATVLSAFHNGKNPRETARVLHEHPGEPDVIHKDRVLGSLAVTRAMGDHMFKLPSIYTTRVFRNASGALRTTTPASQYTNLNRSPPYVSNTPSVRHAALNVPRSASHSQRHHRNTDTYFLVLCSDGLTDLYEHQHMSHRETVATIAKTIERAIRAEGLDGKRRNLALCLLRHALGGEDATKVSRMLTVELQERWMDDTTVLVQRL